MRVLTRAGRSALAVGAVLVIVGLVAGYSTLIGVGVAFLAVVGFAVILVSRPPSVTVEREVRPTRVMAEQPAEVELVIQNQGRRTTPSGVALERFGDIALPVTVPAVPPGESVSVVTALPTDRRGVYNVGPLLINRSDPLALARRGELARSVAELRVHPKIHEVDPYPSGLTRDLDGPNSGEAPEGGVAFQNLREYVVGDDLRLIHWRSSAKSGQLMVRHNVDSHQPRSLILLDTRPDTYSADSFEDAVRVTASIATASLRRRFPFKLRTTAGFVIERTTPAQLLDELAALEAGPGDFENMLHAATQDLGGYSLSIITGSAPVSDLISVGPLRSRFDNITIVRTGIGDASESVQLPGALLINVGTSVDFARAWNRRLRR
ncbi:MAG: DUF58 domain-containing protein [Acidimicrobiia bacterium]|nr:DUF58 domain-containing protein [Acidimicrobiia bacterium]